MDEQKGEEERNAHTEENELRVGSGGVVCGRRQWLSSAGRGSTREGAPLSTSL